MNDYFKQNPAYESAQSTLAALLQRKNLFFEGFNIFTIS